MLSLENKENYKRELGHFIMKFAELEFSFLYYFAIIDNPRTPNIAAPDYLRLKFGERRDKITTFIKENLPALKNKWEIINSKIGTINEERRALIHGIGQSYFYNDSIKTAIKKGNNIKQKEYTIDNIRKLISDIETILTGDNGVTGDFLTEFTTQRFNHYNLERDEPKIIYKVNGIILTDYKG